MLSQRRLTADRGHSPVSYDSFADSDDPREDVFPDVNHVSKGGPASDNDIEFGGEQEVREDENASDLDALAAPETNVAAISFGALARAQASLFHVDGKTRQRPIADPVPTTTSSRSTECYNSSAGNLRHEDGQKEQRQRMRISKHAPTELSSKKAVSRKRSVVPIPKRDVRDPRFENAFGPINEQKIKNNYAFLEEYREIEMKELRAELKKTKSDLERERLKKEILRMESKKGAQDRKTAEQEVLRRHRKEERAKVESGKAPFYLKRAQVKKEALVERYGRMKAKEVDKLIERRRKKRASRDKKHTPRERRVGAI